jgi:hypothetical protein
LIATLLSAAVTCVVSLALGQAALRLAGAREWSWLAPPVGISVAMALAAIALWIPGHATTITVLVGILTVAALVWCGLDPAHRPPLSGLLAGLPVAVLVLVPFLAAGHSGTLGVSFDNDMAAHLLIVEHYLSPSSVAEVSPAGYPIAAHGMVALISRGLDMRADHAFAGWSMALPLLSAWTALALVPRASWIGRALTATVVGMPFLVAAYYGEGAFKEVLQACLVLAGAVFFAGCGPRLGRGRWVPLALILSGVISIYSTPGVAWPVVFGVLWLLVVATIWVRRNGGISGWTVPVVAELPAIGIGLAVFVISILPQISRVWTFAQDSGGAGLVGKQELGNLAGPLPGWEAFGVWNTADFRLPSSPAFTGGMWTAFVVALVLLGAAWLLRRGRWMLPVAAAGSMFIWAVTQHSQSPYVAAKALVIASPLLLAVAIVPLAEQLPARPWHALRSAFRAIPGQPLAWGVTGILALVLFVRVGISDGEALRVSPVGPTAHTDELRELRPLLQGQPTLFLGDDDFARWELAGVPIQGPVIALPELPIRPQKHWEYGEAFDFDSVDAATLNEFEWVITTRDAAGSSPPPQMHVAKTTPNYVLWHRDGKVQPRSILNEGQMPGAILDCQTPGGRRVLAGGGVAAERREPVVAPGFYMGPGGTSTVEMHLPPGRYELELAYTSRLSITVTAAGLRTTVPANLDRPGPRWPLGQVTVKGGGPTPVTLTVANPLLAPGILLAEIGSVVAAPVGKDHLIPVRKACGKYVDWYRGAASAR